MYLEYSASGTIETNNIYDNMSLGKYVGIEYVRANAEGLRAMQFSSYSTESRVGSKSLEHRDWEVRG